MNQIKVLAAAKSLSNQWFPVNPTTHTVVVTKLRKGFYAKDITPLFADLMGDLSLFGYCLRQLMNLAREGKIPRPALFDMVSLFRAAGPEALGAILAAKDSEISTHDLEKVSDHQLGCMRQALLCSAASEALSEKLKLPQGIGFSCAFLRQLGLTLIAWNYPHVLRQALLEVSRGATLDETLLKTLGYTPKVLALALARDWGFGEEILAAMGDKKALSVSADERLKKIAAASDLLSKMCEIGETLSQAALPDLYPQAKGGWDDARRKMEAVLGPAGMVVIEGRFKSLARNYVLANNQQIAKLAILPAALQSRDSASVAKAEMSNSAFSYDRCSPKLRKELELLRSKIIPGKPNKELIVTLATKLIPLAGFCGGSIYTFDIDSQTLLPRFRFGQCTLGTQNVPCSTFDSRMHPAAEAFRSDHAVIVFDPWSEEGHLGYVAHVFGSIQRVGVLYVEIGKELEQLTRNDVLEVFDLLKRTLQECLSIK